MLAEAADGGLALDPALGVDALQLLREEGPPVSDGLAFEGLDGVGSPELDVWLLRWRGQLGRRRVRLLALAWVGAPTAFLLHFGGAETACLSVLFLLSLYVAARRWLHRPLSCSVNGCSPRE